MKKLLAVLAVAIGLAAGASAKTINLANVTENTTVADGTTLKGTLGGAYKISIAAGARVTLKGVTINRGGAYPGLTCLGDATITLSGDNVVNAKVQGYPGIFVPYANKLRIKGSGSLTVRGYGNAAGIGTGKSHGRACGEISIEGGDITAYGGSGSSDGDYSGDNCPGIGAVDGVRCRAISILRGNVNSYANRGASWSDSPYSLAPAIGARSSVDCPKLTIGEAIGKVYAEATNLVEPINVGSIVKDESLSDTGSVTVSESSQVIGDRNFRKRTITSSLGSLKGSKTFKDGDVIIGELVNDYKISIAKDATVTLRNVTIPGSTNGKRPGIHCLGDATIILEGVNTVASYGEDLPAIFVTEDKTLTIRGSGSLKAIGGNNAAGIGGSYISGVYGVTVLTPGKDYGPFVVNAGMVVIESGDVVAKGGASGIGGGRDSTCQAVEIKGGYVRASYTGGFDGATSIKTTYLTIPGLVDGSMRRSQADNTLTVKWGGDLSKLTATDNHHPIAADGTVIRGTLGTSLMRKVSIAAGASVTLQDVKISGYHYDQYPWAGLTCLGDATITLVGDNSVKTYHNEYPGVYVPEGCTLTFKGDGSIEARARANTGYAAGIGSGKAKECSIAGNVTIENGMVDAKGYRGSGIGGVNVDGSSPFPPKNFGNLTINGGLVKAWSDRTSDNYIGAGTGASCGKVTIASNMMRNVRDYSSLRCMVVSWDGTLGTIDRNVIAADGTTITGTLGGVESRKKISIEPDATVTLSDAKLLGTNNSDLEWAGITCLGNATINLEGENKVKGFYQEYPAIYIPQGFNLVINGPGSLKAMVNGGPSYGETAAIGGGKYQPFGDITINGGTIEATGCQNRGAGIGGATYSDCTSTITINGGNITATGGNNSAGIGSGGSRCGAITINGGTVSAIGGANASGIGNSSASSGTCSAIAINSGISCVTATAGEDGTPIASATTPSVARVLNDSTSGLVRTIKWSGSLGTLWTYGTSGMELIATDGMTINGTLQTKACKITIAPDAHVTLNNAKINTNGTFSDNTRFAGITCLGNATITLLNTSEIKPWNGDYPCIYVPQGCRLTILGSGTLKVYNYDNSAKGAGIGGGDADDCRDCGFIEIYGGTIDARCSGEGGAAIGGGKNGWCDGVRIGPGIISVDASNVFGDSYLMQDFYRDASPVGYGAGGDCGPIEVAEGAKEVYTGLWTRREFAPEATTSPDPDPDPGQITDVTVNLSNLNSAKQLVNGDVVTGTLSGSYALTVAAGATITLRDVKILGGDDSSYSFPGIKCLGNATIWLEGYNQIFGFYHNPAVTVASGYTLTIKSRNGNDKLVAGTVLFDSQSAGIGAGGLYSCGNIVIDGGIISAYGGTGAAGIGGAEGRSCGDITINGGTVDAYGGADGGAGIGCGVRQGNCGTIRIYAGITKVHAYGRGNNNHIGVANTSSVGGIYVHPDLTDVTKSNGRVIIPRNEVDLSTLSTDSDPFVVEDLATITGTLGANRKIVIAAGAAVTLSGVTINGYSSLSYDWAGITCEGDAIIILEGENSVKGSNNHPGIFVPADRTLTIKGSGSLVARSWGEGAGIGGGYDSTFHELSCGNIVIEGGTITATGGEGAAGIGGSSRSDCGNITVKGGYVSATGGKAAAGIGCGVDRTCGYIDIKTGANYVLATAGTADDSGLIPLPIGRGVGYNCRCNGIHIDTSLVSANGGNTKTILPKSLDLSKVDRDVTILNGMTIRNTLGGKYKVSIEPDAIVTLQSATINGTNNEDYNWAGLTCLGNATLVLSGTSAVRGFCEDYPGIYVPVGGTLTIQGDGSLTADNNGWAAGIGGGYNYQSDSSKPDLSCGSIVIEGGTVTAVGRKNGAGIGGANRSSCDGVVINGGTVYATGGNNAPGIGSGAISSCGDIAIAAGITRVEATPGTTDIGAIGAGVSGTCGDVSVDRSLVDVIDDDTKKRVIRSYDVIDLSTVTSDIVLTDFTLATGTLATPCKVSIAAGARVRLRDADINGAGEWTNKSWAGLTCLGDATIELEGSNTVKSSYVTFAGIYVPTNTTLTITGEGFLDVAAMRQSGETYGAAGIGGNGGTSYYNNAVRNAGNIVFAGGKVVAYAGNNSSAIGCSYGNNCSNITFEAGIISVDARMGGIGKTYPDGTEGTITVAPELERTGNYICHQWDGNLDTLDRNATAKDGTVISGSNSGAYTVHVADGATVTLDGATVPGTLTCDGDATIVLVGENTARIAATNPHTLTIRGDGSLLAEGGDGWEGTPGISGGNIVIESGSIVATGGGQARGAAAIGGVYSAFSSDEGCGDIMIGPGVTKVVATVKKITLYDNATGEPIGHGGGVAKCGTVTVDTTKLTDTTSEDETTITRTIVRAADADVAAAFEAWKTMQNANGANISGAWDATDANGVPNALRYVFGKAGDDEFTGVVIIGFYCLGEGAVAIQTLPVVNGKDLFTFTVVASDNANGTGNVAEYPLAIDDPDGITIIEEEYNPNRFFRIRIGLK